MKKTLIVYCSMTGNTKAGAEAIAKGVGKAGGEALLKEAKDAKPEDLIEAGAVALGSYDSFSYMGGGLKDFLDRAFYPSKDRVAGKPFAAFMSHGSKGLGLASVEAAGQIFKLEKIASSVRYAGKPDAKALAELEELGAKLAKAAN